MNIKIIKVIITELFTVILLVAIFCFAASNSVNASEYIDSDDFMSDDSYGSDSDNISATEISNVNNRGMFTIALSNNVRSLCEIPDGLKMRLYNAVEQEVIDSGKFKVITLNRSIQNELKEELERVITNEIEDADSVSIGRVSGVKYILVLTIIDFSVQKDNKSKNSKYKYGAIMFKIGVNSKVVDTSTHAIISSKNFTVLQRAALPKDQFNYIDKGTTIDENSKSKNSSSYDLWTREGDDEYHTNKPKAFAESSFKAEKKNSDYDGQDVEWKNTYNLEYDDTDIGRNFKGKRVMANISSNSKSIKDMTHSGEIKEDSTFKELYRLSQANFASNALTKASKKLGEGIACKLVNEFYPMRVIKILKGGLLAINYGKDNGIKKGQLYEAMAVSTGIDPDTGKEQVFKVSEGVIKVTEVSEKSSVGKIISDDKNRISVETVLIEAAEDTYQKYDLKDEMKKNRIGWGSFDSDW